MSYVFFVLVALAGNRLPTTQPCDQSVTMHSGSNISGISRFNLDYTGKTWWDSYIHVPEKNIVIPFYGRKIESITDKNVILSSPKGMETRPLDVIRSGSLRADFDQDGDCDMTDFGILQRNLGTCSLLHDLTDDNKVNADDIKRFTEIICPDKPLGIDIGNGFTDHGVATPLSESRGVIATQDAGGSDIVLMWMYDSRQGYGLLTLNPDTGTTEEFKFPFGGRDGPFASIYSSQNCFYTHVKGYFVEFNTNKCEYTFFQPTSADMAMSMIEDDAGIIWSATYPNSRLFSYNPTTKEFIDYGSINKENWAQYPRYLAADDQGWIYVGIGQTKSLVLAFNPKTRETNPVHQERMQGIYGQIYRDMNGKVYAFSGEYWYELYGGTVVKIGTDKPRINVKPIIAGNQGLIHRQFPSGRKLISCDTVKKVIITESVNKERIEKSFTYDSQGTWIMGVEAISPGIICGGTAFPMQFFGYSPRTNKWSHMPAYGQWNALTVARNSLFVGAYTSGNLLEWNPSSAWVPTVIGAENCNPQCRGSGNKTIDRPHDVLYHPELDSVVLGGTPGYGYTGGGLYIWDRKAKSGTLLTHEQILPYHSTGCLIDLPEGCILGGTTTSPGTGGERIAKTAELYKMSLKTNTVTWHSPVLPNVSSYSDFAHGPNGLIYGVGDSNRFFVFDPVKQTVVYEKTTNEFGNAVSGQSRRIFVPDGKGNVYMLFTNRIAKINPKTFGIELVTTFPYIAVGGAYWNGRIYFGGSSHLYSYKLQ